MNDSIYLMVIRIFKFFILLQALLIFPLGNQSIQTTFSHALDLSNVCNILSNMLLFIPDSCVCVSLSPSLSHQTFDTLLSVLKEPTIGFVVPLCYVFFLFHVFLFLFIVSFLLLSFYFTVFFSYPEVDDWLVNCQPFKFFNITFKAIIQPSKYFFAVTYMFLIGKVSFLIIQLKNFFKISIMSNLPNIVSVLFTFLLLIQFDHIMIRKPLLR